MSVDYTVGSNPQPSMSQAGVRPPCHKCLHTTSDSGLVIADRQFVNRGEHKLC